MTEAKFNKKQERIQIDTGLQKIVLPLQFG